MRDHRLGMLIEALAQTWRRRHLGRTERRLEELILAPVLDGVEVTFARAQQPDTARDAIGVCDAVTQRNLAEAFGEHRVLQCTSDKR